MASKDIESEDVVHSVRDAISSNEINLNVGEGGGILVEDLPFEVIQRFLTFVPDADLEKCIVVCKLWKEAISDQSFWKQKCEVTGRYVEKYMAPYYPSDWKTFYLKSPFARNLIRNCSGQDSSNESELDGWDVLSNGGNQWQVQRGVKPPGSGQLPEELVRLNAGKPACFATSYGWCEKEQVIDLLAEGFSEAILDELRPTIFVSEWYAARFDCGNVYEFGVQLLKGRPMKSEGESEVVIAAFHFGPLQTPQWADRNWKRATHTYKGYGPGLRYIRFWDKSRDTQFWAGHYGAKMAGAEVRFLIGNEEPPSS